MSTFDPEAFLSATTTEALEKRPPLPVGEYVAVTGKPTIRTFQGKKDPTQTFTALDIPVTLEIPADLQGEQQLPASIRLTHGGFLDVSNGQLDMAPGKNTFLRRVREALDLNKPGEPFSLNMIEGRPIRVKVKHEEYQGNLQERVDSVAGV